MSVSTEPVQTVLGGEKTAPVPTLVAEGLTLAYDRREVVHGLDLRVPSGQVTVVVGANGCGKSTLLKLLDGLIFPDSGSYQAFGQAVTDMFEARKARTVAPETGSAAGRRFVAEAAGSLFGRSYALSEEVHQAMVARGYRGEARTLDRFHVGLVDLAWTLGCALLVVLVLGGDRLLGR